MISPLRKANDTLFSLVTPCFQTYSALANRKHRQRQISFCCTDGKRNERIVREECTEETSICIAYAWQYMLGVLYDVCEDDLYTLSVVRRWQ